MSQMAAIDIGILMPETTLLVFSFAILLLTPFLRRHAWAPGMALAAVAVAFVFVVTGWDHQRGGYFDMVLRDNFALFAKIIFLTVCGLTVLLSHDWLARHGIDRAEYYALLLISVVGMMVMTSSLNLMVIFLGLEIMSLPLYVMAGMRKDNLRSTEASAKYFFMGAFASAFFLYGIALIFGASGTTDLRQVFMTTGIALQKHPLYLTAGAGMVLIGFAFKIASFPFHMWVPDVYQGAPTPVTAFFSIGPKAAGVAALLRIFMVGFGGLTASFTPLFWMLAVLTMTVGNLLAIKQDDVKRMLAYSSIAHAGYLLVAVTAGGSEAVSAALFYLLAYAFFNFGAFAIVAVVENLRDGSNHVDTYKGLAARHPWLAVFLALFMFSLAGFPPTAGFFGKFTVFAAAVKSGHVTLVVIAVLNSLISVFYYLRPVKAAFFEKEDVHIMAGAPDAGNSGLAPAMIPPALEPRLHPMVALAIGLTALGTLVLGLLPGWFLQLAVASVFMMM